MTQAMLERGASQRPVPAPGVPADGRAEVLSLAAGGGLHFAGTVFSQAVLFAIVVIVARVLGGGAVGLYSQALALLAILELLALSGFRDGLTRFVAVYRADGDAAALRGTVRLGVGLSSVCSVVVAGVLYVVAPWFAASVFDDPALTVPLKFVALALPGTVIINAALSASTGFRTMRYRAGIGLLAVPTVRLALTGALLAAGFGLAGVMGALCAAHTVGAIAALAALRKQMGRPAVRATYPVRQLLGFSLVSWTASLTNTGLIWVDSLLLGIYLPSEEVGVYQVATRLVMFAVLAMVPVNAAFAPQIADLERRGESSTLKRTYGAATSWILRISLPAFVVLVVFPHEALSIFGPGFGAGAAVTVILVAGKLVDASTGPCGVMLNQSGRPALNLVNNVGALVLNVGLNLVLIPRHGIVGSAVAWTVSLTVVNLARVVEVWLFMRMLPVNRGSAHGLVAAVVAAGCGVIVQRSALDGLLLLLAGTVVVSLAYVGVLLALGLPADDRAVLADMRRRLRRRR